MVAASQPTRRDRLGKHLAIGFAIAAALYISCFRLIEYFREVKGPWQVHFRTDDIGEPSVSVAHEKLAISNVTFVFPGERVAQTNMDDMVEFDAPKTNAPFGRIVFIDTTFLPGTVTFDLFGHEIELLPRTLVLNLKEVPWKSDTTYRLSEKEKPKRR